MGPFAKHVFICTSGSWCATKDGDGLSVHAYLKKRVGEAGLQSSIRINHSGCLDQCGHGPMIVVYPENVWYWGVTLADAQAIFEEHLVGGTPVERLCYHPAKPGKNKLPRDDNEQPIGRPARTSAEAV
jgi:(2Fe-2S) ferredoxin